MKTKLTQLLERVFGANTVFNATGFAFVVALLIQYFPQIIAPFPKELQADIHQLAYHALREGVLVLFLYGKQRNVSGNGTTDAPVIKAEPDGQSRQVK